MELTFIQLFFLILIFFLMISFALYFISEAILCFLKIERILKR